MGWQEVGKAGDVSLQVASVTQGLVFASTRFGVFNVSLNHGGSGPGKGSTERGQAGRIIDGQMF